MGTIRFGYSTLMRCPELCRPLASHSSARPSVSKRRTVGRAQNLGSPWDCEHLSGNGQGAKQHLCGIGEAPSSQTRHHHLIRAAGLQGKDRTHPFWKHCRTSACYVAPLAPASTTLLVVLSEMPQPLEKGLWPHVPPSSPSQWFRSNRGFIPETGRLTTMSHVQLVLTPRGPSPAPQRFLIDAGLWQVSQHQAPRAQAGGRRPAT